jgi:hypothetical protein
MGEVPGVDVCCGRVVVSFVLLFGFGLGLDLV